MKLTHCWVFCICITFHSGFAESIETIAVVRELEEIEVPARRDGFIEELTVRRGMQVDKGQLLSRLNTRDLNLKLDVARAEKQQAEIKAENDGPVEAAVTAVQRAEVENKLLKELGDHAVYLEQFRMENSLQKSAADLKTAKQQLRQDKQLVDVKDAELAILKNDISQMLIHSPVKGVVREISKQRRGMGAPRRRDCHDHSHGSVTRGGILGFEDCRSTRSDRRKRQSAVHLCRR